ncbi:hypothetical protein PALB_9610 [Pseudoalteromonas luteoviolacea B = ATCC 29581]|nr:hypothetical protein PALB_9610 [Pseudoalteromonas luteoviolacea B = ATCC 29581]
MKMYLSFTGLLLSSVNSYASEHSPFILTDVDTSFADTTQKSKAISRFKMDIGVESDWSNTLTNGSYSVVSYSIFRGENASNFTQDLQSFSNIDDSHYSKFYEAYFGTPLAPSTFLKFGLMDATNDFAAAYYGGGFINASMGFSPTIGGISTFPTPKLGAHIHKQFKHWALKLGAYSDADNRLSFSDSFQIAEIEVPYAFKSTIRFGAWYHTGLATKTSSVENTNDYYMVIDHHFSDSMSGFVQFGNANTKFTDLNTHWSVGLNYLGLLLENSYSGIMVSEVDVVGKGSETTYEFYTDIALNDYLTIKPGLIYIDNVAGDDHLGSAQIFNVRLSAAF